MASPADLQRPAGRGVKEGGVKDLEGEDAAEWDRCLIGQTD